MKKKININNKYKNYILKSYSFGGVQIKHCNFKSNKLNLEIKKKKSNSIILKVKNYLNRKILTGKI